MALDRGELDGFVNVCWDGGEHAFLLDTAVAPGLQGRGIGPELVWLAVVATRAAGCHWLHVDYQAQLAAFYSSSFAFRPSPAAVIDLRGDA